MNRWLILVLSLLAGLPAADSGLPLLHDLFTDDMVLQRGVAAPVWGWCAPGRTVEVELCGQRVAAIADATGRWTVRVGPFPAGGPHDLTISGPATVIRHGVMIGDVWLCAGQSNMEFGLTKATGGAAAVATADDPGLRLYSTHRLALAPQATFPHHAWRVCSPQSVAKNGGFSAVGYFFGRQLRQELKVPIGLLQIAWGGSPAESWMSPEALTAFGDFAADQKILRDILAERASGLTPAQQNERWWQAHDPAGQGWSAEDLEVTGWQPLTLPTTWAEAGFPAFRGITWLRRTCDLTEAWREVPAELQLGEIGTIDTAWINGHMVGETIGRHHERTYRVPAGTLRAGRNVITLRVLNHGLGGFFGPGALQLAAAGIAPLGLDGPWLHRRGPAYDVTQPFPGLFGGDEPAIVSSCFNGMIAPLIPFACTGVLWYQGEGHGARTMQYRRLLPALIADWRNHFEQCELPFLIVQLPNFASSPAKILGDAPWAELREAQALSVAQTPRTGLVVTIDVGDDNEGHPPAKLDIGLRLAQLAKAQVYGLPIDPDGPICTGVTFVDDQVHVVFDHVGDGLVARGSSVRGFILAGADGRFVQAVATLAGDTAIVSAQGLARPTAVRYGWANTAVGNLFNRAGLPARPFRSDVPPTTKSLR